MTSLFARFTHSKHAMLATKAALTLLVFWLLLRGIDADSLTQMLKNQNRGAVAAAFFLLLAQVIFGGVRWKILLASLASQGERVLSMLEALRIFYVGIFFGYCLPGTVGNDVVRVWFAKQLGVPTPLAIHSVIIDRVMALIALVFMTAIMLLVFGNYEMSKILPMMIALTAIGVWFLFRVDKMFANINRLRLVRWLLYFAASMRLIMRRPWALMAALLISVLSHAGFCVGTWLLAGSLGIDMNLMQTLALVPPVILATAIPISIGGWGVREAGFVGMLSLIHVPQAPALMLSIQLGLLGLLSSLPAGILWLMSRKEGTPE